MRRRSHSFRHHSPVNQSSIVVDHHQRVAVDDNDGDGNRHHRQRTRRCSTPNAVRRLSSSNNYLFTDHINRGRELARTDVWPAAKTSPQSPDHPEDYTRVRQFDIDAKGALVSHDDSFRRNEENKRSGMSVLYNAMRRYFLFQVPIVHKVLMTIHATAAYPPLHNTPPPMRPLPHRNVLHIISACSARWAPASRHWSVNSWHPNTVIHFLAIQKKVIFSICLMWTRTLEDNVENTVSVSIGGRASDLTFFEFDSNEV